MNGYQNEFEIINYLNNKQYGQVNVGMQELLKALYPDIKEEDVIQARKYGYYAKVDMVISVNGVEKGISIKCGYKNSVHVEPIKKFMLYLRKMKFSKIEILLRYLYSDGTSNNTGKVRQSAADYKIEHENDIILMNDEFEKIKKNLLIRFLIETDIKYKIKVDAFISGYINDFLWATTLEVLEYLSNTTLLSSGIHVSNLFIQNWNKNLKYNPKYEYCREYIQVKWYSISDDLIQIMYNRHTT